MLGVIFAMGMAACVVGAALLGGSGGATAHAAAIHPAVLADLQAAPDGQTTFFVLLAEQPSLAPAERIDDWRAKGRWVFDTLQAAARRSQAPVRRSLAAPTLARHISHWQEFWIVNALLVRGDAQAVEILARQPGVARILPQVKLEPPEIIAAQAPAGQSPSALEWNIHQINADDVWALGYRGEGMVVANVDTGVDYTHPALVRQYRGNQGSGGSGPFSHNYNWFDPFWGTTAPQALPWPASGGAASSHGTHVMGIEVGSDGGRNEVGVAPNARWIASFGCCPDNETLLEALQWMLAPTHLDGSQPDPDLRPHTLENSWGGPGGSLIFGQAMAALKAAGVFVVASAGNNGSACGSLGSPGDNPAVFSVGASNAADRIASFSARGPDPFSRDTGPDLVTPGDAIRSTVPGNRYSVMSGTSMAGPHVAGAVALLWQANPALVGRVDYTAELLRQTAQPVFTAGQTCGNVDSGTTHPNNSAGWGRLDVLRAVQVAGNGRSRLSIRVTDEAGVPLPRATATLHRPDPELGTVTLVGTAGDEGRFDFLVAPGPVTVTVELFGYEPATISTTVSYLHIFPLAESNLQPGAAAAAIRSQATPIQLRAASRVLGIALRPAAQMAVDGIVHEAGSTDKRLAARVSLPGAPLPAVETDCTGAFSLTLPAGSHELLVEATGYESRRIPLAAQSAVTATIALTPTWDYLVADSRSGDVVFQWIDATGGQRYDLDDDDSQWFMLPAAKTFTFYGRDFSDLYLTSNGLLTFGEPFDRFHGVIPYEGQPNNAIYAYAEDLNPAANRDYNTGYDNGIYTHYDAQGGRLIVQYNEVEHWSRGNPETFEAILHLATGQITLQYQQVSWPDYATVGVEDATGLRGIPYSYANSADLQAELAVRFTPVFGQPGSTCRQ